MPDKPIETASAAALVREFLTTMEARDLARAEAFLAPGFTMTFPGGGRFTSLREVVEWARPRYRWCKKRYDRFDAAPLDSSLAGGGAVAVYCFGTLYGEWPDGRAFEGIRFIDRFTVVGGKFTEQMVWNDMGEARAQHNGETKR
jgi:hypothetical protein